MADQLAPPRPTSPPQIPRVALPPATEFAELRARLVWLSADIAMLRMLCETRSLAPAESARLLHLRDESDRLQARLTDLRDAALQN